MGSKQQLYTDFLRKEGFLPDVAETGDIRFKIQGEIFVITCAEDDPNYFKLSYFHAWDANKTERAWPVLNALNAKFKVVKLSALGDVLCLTTETFLKEPGDFESLFSRCVQMINVSKNELAKALTPQESPTT